MITWRIERHVGESAYYYAVRRLRVASVAGGVTVAIFVAPWWLFPFTPDHGFWTLFFSFTITALAGLFALSTVICVFFFVISAAWHYAERRYECPKMLRILAGLAGAWFSPVFLFCLSTYALFQVFSKGNITFFGKRMTYLISGQDQPLDYLSLIVFWLFVWIGSAAWIGYKLHSLSQNNTKIKQ